LTNPHASVVVCTRNRGGALEPALASLVAQEAPFEWEVLVVDNRSSDDTAEVARAFARRHRERVRVEVEPDLGLSAARNAGVRLARGSWIAFLDDDAEAEPGWLAAYEDAWSGADVLSAGGPVEPLFDGPLPEWLGERYLPYLSVWDRGPEAHDLLYNELPRGANMAYRRAAFERVGEFDPRLGRRGRSLRSCEEIELGLRLERIGGRCRYVPRARVRHHVAVERLTPGWMRARFAAQGFSEAILDWKHGGWRRLRRGLSERRRGMAWVVAEEGASSLRAGFERAATTSYRRGALYALVAIRRWDPPAV